MEYEMSMEKERVAELRIYERSLRVNGQMTGMVICEALDALEAAQTERDTRWDAVEGAYREGYRQRGIDEDCTKRPGPPCAGLAWEHSDARLDLLK
jgi:hypothetical protein